MPNIGSKEEEGKKVPRSIQSGCEALVLVSTKPTVIGGRKRH